jgi:hypothetical protein
MSISAYVLSKPILTFLWENAKKPTERVISHAAEALESRISKWIDSKLTEPPPLTIRADELEKFTADLVHDAPKFGVTEDNARRICQALVTCLALQRPQDAP